LGGDEGGSTALLFPKLGILACKHESVTAEREQVRKIHNMSEFFEPVPFLQLAIHIPVSQQPVSCVFHSGMLLIKESKSFVKIKAAGVWGQA
jgi:hypothetical protein